MKHITLTAAIAALALQSGSAAPPKPADIFTDHAVLQRDTKLPLWGTADPNAEVTVTIAKDGTKDAPRTAKTRADKDGKWRVDFPPFSASAQPHTVTFAAGAESAAITDVLFGDVWICSGQSNMDMNYNWGLTKGREEIEQDTHPAIRLLVVPRTVSPVPRADLRARWKPCAPENAKSFSAVGYFFGTALQRAMPDVPVGLVDTAWNGSRAETWLPLSAAAQVPPLKDAAAARKNLLDEWFNGNGREKQAAALEEWKRRLDPLGAQNPQAPEFDDSAWKSVELPAQMEKSVAPNFDGTVWYRTAVELTAEQAAKPARITLGWVDDQDVTYVNGVKVGAFEIYNVPRNYTLKPGILRPGKNTIAVRVIDLGGDGGFTSKPEELALVLGDEKVSLAKAWRYHATPLDRNNPKPRSMDDAHPDDISTCYNGMIAPLFPLAIKGAIWYQGCSNVGRVDAYADLMDALVRDWRANFSGGDLPFYIVQLAAFMDTHAEPRDSGWARMRWVQTQLGETLGNSGTAVTLDIGDHKDIHPKNKKDVGERLARLALARTFGKKHIVEAGPIPVAVSLEGASALRVTFKNADGIGGRDGAKITGFQLAGADGKFVWADARVVGKDVVVSVNGVAHPATVRYAWDDYPECNLVNAEGLPCGPFELRTNAN